MNYEKTTVENKVPVLSVKGISVELIGRGGRWNVIHDACLEIPPRKIIGLIGESGGGKSVFWKSIFGLLDGSGWHVSGRALLRGVPLDFSDEELTRSLRGSAVSIVPQDPVSSFDPLCTIWNHFYETARTHTDMTQGQIREIAENTLAELSIEDPRRVLASYPFQCSGGMLQRVMIAIAVMLKPILLLADEPTTSVDVSVRKDVLSILRKLNRDKGASILLISHDLKSVMSIADDIHVMYAGYIVERISAAKMAAGEMIHPYTKKLYRARPDFQASG